MTLCIVLVGPVALKAARVVWNRCLTTVSLQSKLTQSSAVL